MLHCQGCFFQQLLQSTSVQALSCEGRRKGTDPQRHGCGSSAHPKTRESPLHQIPGVKSMSDQLLCEAWNEWRVCCTKVNAGCSFQRRNMASCRIDNHPRRQERAQAARSSQLEQSGCHTPTAARVLSCGHQPHPSHTTDACSRPKNATKPHTR